MKNLSNLQHQITEKRSEIVESEQFCEKSVELWVKNIQTEIKENTDMCKMTVSKHPLLMKEGRDMIIAKLSPRPSETETGTYAPELLAEMSNELNDHYDAQANLAHL